MFRIRAGSFSRLRLSVYAHTQKVSTTAAAVNGAQSANFDKPAGERVNAGWKPLCLP
jgi:hypothetical protein